MERIYGCEVKPYLGDHNSVDAEKHLKSADEPDDDDPDYTIEKFLFYDDFVMKLQVFEIIYSAYMMLDKLFKVG